MAEDIRYFLDDEQGETRSGTIEEGATMRDVLTKLGYSEQRIESELSIYNNMVSSSPDSVIKTDPNNPGVAHLNLQVKVDNG